MEKDKKTEVGINPQTFPVILEENWEQYNINNISDLIQYSKEDIDDNKTYYIGFDPYEPTNIPINLYHKVRKFLGLKFRAKETESKAICYKIDKDGTIRYI